MTAASSLPLTPDQQDLAAMLDSLAAKREVRLADDSDVVSPLIGELAGLGIWTLGVTEDLGGGGADAATTAVALERLGRHWPALGWSSSQAHAAVEVLRAEPNAEGLVAGIVAGNTRVAVVDADSHSVHLDWSDGRLVGTVDRVDPAGNDPHLLILRGADSAVLVSSRHVSGHKLARTGLAGAFTQRLDVDAAETELLVLEDAEIDAVRARLAARAAAVASGIAGGAADAAHAYASGRHQFGGPLTNIATVRASLLSQLALATNAARLAISSPSDITGAFAALTTACGAAIDVSAAAVQSHGGYGYLTEYPVERHLRDAISLRAAVDVAGLARTASARHLGDAHRTTRKKGR